MVSSEHVQQLLTELGPVVEAELVTQYDESSWSIALSETTMIEVEFDPEGQKVTLSLDLGRPDAARRLATYEAALMCNYLWSDPGVTRMALDGPEGSVIQIFELPAAGLDLESLHGALRNFVNHAGRWRDVLREGGVDWSAEAALPEDFEAPGGIRV